MSEYCLKLHLIDQLKLVTSGARAGRLYRFKNAHDAIDFVYEHGIQDKVHVLLMKEDDYYDYKSVPLKTLQKSEFNTQYGVWEEK